MKRHRALETLSFEHHDALVVALRIKKGLKKAANLSTIAAYALAVFNNHLAHHFEQEETALGPHLKHNPKTAEAYAQMENEHTLIRQQIQSIKQANDQLQQHLQTFANQLEQHIRFEERVLFKLAEEHLNHQALQTIEQFLHKHHQPINKDWEIQFWKD